MASKLEDIALEIRQKIFKTAIISKAGHIASSLSMVDIITVLYFGEVLKYDSKNPELIDRDRFILSKGHGALALYSVLAKAGYFNESELVDFCKPHSNLGCHPKLDKMIGVEASTGSLGHGLSLGVGISLAGKLDKKDYNVYVLMGDGECQEGSVWEAALTASHYNLTNLTVIVDYNKLQASERLKSVANIEPFNKKWESFGFNVIEVDGHNMHDIKCAFETKSNLPKIIIANTIKGKGISYIENQLDWHSRMPDENEINKGLIELKILSEEPLNL